MLLQPASGDRLNGKCGKICRLNVGDIQQREGVPHLCAEGKGDKVHHLPLYVPAQWLLAALRAREGNLLSG
jgi:hypothetical protein